MSNPPPNDPNQPWSSPWGEQQPQPGWQQPPPPQDPSSPWATEGTAAAGQPYPPPQYGAYPPQPGTNTLAIVSLVCSLAGLVTCISAPVGAVLGHIARKQIRQTGEQGDGMALAGIIVGWVLTALLVIGCGVYAVFFGWLASQGTTT